jgi:hypothetical protein
MTRDSTKMLEPGCELTLMSSMLFWAAVNSNSSYKR